jgi:hypothetical protein
MIAAQKVPQKKSLFKELNGSLLRFIDGMI